MLRNWRRFWLPCDFWGGGQTPGTFGGVESKAQKQHIQCCDNLILQLSKATGAKAQLSFRYSGYILSSHDDFHAVDAEHRIEPLLHFQKYRNGTSELPMSCKRQAVGFNVGIRAFNRLGILVKPFAPLMKLDCFRNSCLCRPQDIDSKGFCLFKKSTIQRQIRRFTYGFRSFSSSHGMPPRTVFGSVYAHGSWASTVNRQCIGGLTPLYHHSPKCQVNPRRLHRLRRREAVLPEGLGTSLHLQQATVFQH